MAPNGDQKRDAVLVLRIRRGDKQALDSLFRSYWVRLSRYARTLTRSDDLAQDVVQEVFFRMWRSREKLDISGAVSFYLYKAVRNQALSMITADRSAVFRDARWIADRDNLRSAVTNEGDISLATEDILHYVMHKLSSLPPRSREIFLLSWQHNLSYNEISDLLGISTPTIRNQMSRAVTHLARSISPAEVVMGSFGGSSVKGAKVS